MFGIRFYKADPSTFVLATRNGKTIKQGTGLSFFLSDFNTSVAAIPVSSQEAPFIFNLSTADFQEVRVQGQITFRIDDPIKANDVLNYVLRPDLVGFISDDPMKINDRVILSAQAKV